MNEAKIIGIYLAAGKSRRMGSNKLFLPLGDDRLGSRALKTALQSSLDHIVVITRQDDFLEWVHPSLFLEPFNKRWSYLPCPKAEQGQSLSLKCGIQKAQSLQADGIIILLADQPFISKEMLDELISLFNDKRSYDFVAASYNDIPRPPILFSKNQFSHLLKLKGDEGARRLLRKSGCHHGLMKHYDDYANFIDIDTREEYELVKMLWDGNI
ncbi:nucleotidyltransferase family protein [Bacillus songklensis]|uniref:Nucleotidyltransferase family protein n=1 Tax=Bacillus songklensis TaxID=1069116 RepID=A0ABV8B8C7_9BACI